MILSRYTVDILTLVTNLTMDSYDKTIFERIDLALSKIFEFDYPIWTAEYKTTLERKIIFRYMKKEICCETVELWKMMLYERLNSIMPYYNELYKSTIAEYDFTKDHAELITDTRTKTDIVATTGNDSINATVGFNGSNTITMTNDVININDNTIVDCDTPQAKLNGGDYASNIQETKSTNDVSTNGSNNTISIDTTTNVATNDKIVNSTTTTTDTFNHNSAGNNVSIAELILKHRETLINIDNMIVDELYDLFMLIY